MQLGKVQPYRQSYGGDGQPTKSLALEPNALETTLMFSANKFTIESYANVEKYACVSKTHQYANEYT